MGCPYQPQQIEMENKSQKSSKCKGYMWGLSTPWEEEKFHLERSLKEKHWIYTEMWHLASKITIILFNIYVPILYAEKKECWKTLSNFLDAYSPKNIILAGDYNLVFEPKEKRGGINSRDHFLPFVKELIQQWCLLDFKPKKNALHLVKQ